MISSPYIGWKGLDLALKSMDRVNNAMREDGELQETEIWYEPKPLLHPDYGNIYNTYWVITPPEKYRHLLVTTGLIKYASAPHLSLPIHYKIYEHLNEAGREKFKDWTVVPHAVDYKVDLNKRLHPEQHITPDGFLSKSVFFVRDYANKVNIDEILTVDEAYTTKQDAIIRAAMSVDFRRKVRRWALSDGTYPDSSGHKVTEKDYPTYLQRKKEGQRRRANIAAIGEERFIMLLLYFVTGGDIEKAEEIGKAFLRKHGDPYKEYLNTGDKAFIVAMENESDTAETKDLFGQVIVPGVSFNSMLETVIPDTFVPTPSGSAPISAVVPGSVGLTIREYLSEKFKGNI